MSLTFDALAYLHTQEGSVKSLRKAYLEKHPDEQYALKEGEEATRKVADLVDAGARWSAAVYAVSRGEALKVVKGGSKKTSAKKPKLKVAKK
jgi:hypothetical protein